MSDEVDELFGAAGTPAPREGLVITLLVGGLAMAVLGLACSSAPGGLMVLGAWLVVDKDVRRVESGYLPEDCGPRVRALQRLVNVGLGVVLVLFGIQVVLICLGAYEYLWALLANAILPLLRALLG